MTPNSPSAVLTSLYAIDKVAAISVALLWSNRDIDGIIDGQEMRKAAEALARTQDLVPNCPLCAQPLLVLKSHPLCDDQHLDDLMDSFCFEQGCYEPQTTSNYNCDKHDMCEDCGKRMSICGGRCTYDEYEEPDEDPLAGDVEPTGGYFDPSEERERLVATHGERRVLGWEQDLADSYHD